MNPENSTDPLLEKLTELDVAADQSRNRQLFRFLIRWTLTIALAVYFWEYIWVRWVFYGAIVLGVLNLILIFKLHLMVKRFIRRNAHWF